jgi:hypothetical protein
VARRLDLDPAAATGCARRCLDELAERRLGDVLDAARPAALRTRHRLRPRLGAASRTALARGDQVDADVAGHAEGGLGQRQLDRRRGVAAAWVRPPSAREDVVAEERPEQVGQTREVHELLGVELRAGHAFVAEAVVARPRLGV